MLALERPRRYLEPPQNRFEFLDGQAAPVGPSRLLLGPRDERESRPLIDGRPLLDSPDRIEFQCQFGQSVQLVLALADEVVGSAKPADRLRRPGHHRPPLPAGVP